MSRSLFLNNVALLGDVHTVQELFVKSAKKELRPISAHREFTVLENVGWCEDEQKKKKKQ